MPDQTRRRTQKAQQTNLDLGAARDQLQNRTTANFGTKTAQAVNRRSKHKASLDIERLELRALFDNRLDGSIADFGTIFQDDAFQFRTPERNTANPCVGDQTAFRQV